MKVLPPKRSSPTPSWPSLEGKGESEETSNTKGGGKNSDGGGKGGKDFGSSTIEKYGDSSPKNHHKSEQKPGGKGKGRKAKGSPKAKGRNEVVDNREKHDDNTGVVDNPQFTTTVTEGEGSTSTPVTHTVPSEQRGNDERRQESMAALMAPLPNPPSGPKRPPTPFTGSHVVRPPRSRPTPDAGNDETNHQMNHTHHEKDNDSTSAQKDNSPNHQKDNDSTSAQKD